MTSKRGGYVPCSANKVNAECKKIINAWNAFLKENDPNLIEGRDYYIHMRNLVEVVNRCDKRKYYYSVFHKTEEICEYKEVAIQVFWINTLKPFMVINDKAATYNCPNEMFSLYLILAIVQANFEQAYPGTTFMQPSKERISDIVYDFKYCSISREAMISFVETFADTYKVGIEKIFENKRNKNKK